MNTPNFEHTSMLDRGDEVVKLANQALTMSMNNKENQTTFSTLTIYDRYCDQIGKEVKPCVSTAISTLADKLGVPPVMTYESLILWNPLDTDPLLFTDDLAEDEHLFYESHRDIEDDFYSMHEGILSIYNSNQNSTLIESTAAQKRALKKLGTLIGKMRTEAFSDIRPYWDLREHHQKDEKGLPYPGPSGAYTCGMIYLDIALGIKSTELETYSMDDRMLPAISGNGYITLKEVEELKNIVREEGTITQILGGSHPEVQLLHKQLLQFRKAHMQAARKYIGDEGLDTPGTGGSPNAKDYLNSHLEPTAKAVSNIL